MLHDIIDSFEKDIGLQKIRHNGSWFYDV